MAHQFGKLDAHLPIRLKLEGAAHEGRFLQNVGVTAANVFRRLSAPPLELGFGVEQIHLTRPAILKEHNHALGPSRKMAPTRREVAGRTALGRRARSLALEHASQGHSAKAQTKLL